MNQLANVLRTKANQLRLVSGQGPTVSLLREAAECLEVLYQELEAWRTSGYTSEYDEESGYCNCACCDHGI